MKKQFEKYLMYVKLSKIETQTRDIYVQIYMDLWYGTLYVVVEGYQELKLSDKKIDGLLKSKNTDLLKRYRHGIFHYQKDYYDNRLQNFYEETSTVKWVRELSQEFSRFFLEKIKEGKLISPELPKKI